MLNHRYAYPLFIVKTNHVGLDFFISQVHGEVFTYSDPTQSSGPPAPLSSSSAYSASLVLVNIGSGVSMVKVSGPREFERVGGTSLGGGTLWGLLSLLTGARNFDEMLRLAERGDNTAVDMLVGDIYGHGVGYGKIGLKSTTIASSFGKVYRTKRRAEREAEDDGGMMGESSVTAGVEGGINGNSVTGAARHISFRPEDISKSLLYAIR
jgi:type II pantothenate kinase